MVQNFLANHGFSVASFKTGEETGKVLTDMNVSKVFLESEQLLTAIAPLCANSKHILNEDDCDGNNENRRRCQLLP